MAKPIKIWKGSKDATAGAMITSDSAALVGNEQNFIATNGLGTTIAGPLNLMTLSENIRVGGLFVQMNDFVRMIPSTIVTPIPPQIPFPPVAIFANVALTLPFLLALKA